MRNYLILFFYILIFFSCKPQLSNETKSLKIADLYFDVPKDFELKFGKGIEGKTFSIKNKSLVINGSFGTSYKVFFDHPLPIFDITNKISLTKGDSVTSNNIHFSAHPNEDLHWGTFNVNFYLYDSTNNILKIVIQPKVIGKGITGVYVEDPKTEKVFNMYAENLDSSSHKIVRKIIYSMKK